KSFENYIRYIDRKEAKQKEFFDEYEPIIDEKFEKYLDYMNRESAKHEEVKDKSTGLFNEKSDLITKKNVEKYINLLEKNKKIIQYYGEMFILLIQDG